MRSAWAVKRPREQPWAQGAEGSDDIEIDAIPTTHNTLFYTAILHPHSTAVVVTIFAVPTATERKKRRNER